MRQCGTTTLDREGALLSRGIARERQVRKLLEDDGWWVCRAAGSLGDADLVALRGPEKRLIEVKSTMRGPYSGFGPEQRSELTYAAEIAGAEAWLCWWPPRKKPAWYPENVWPNQRLPGEEKDGAADRA